mmetsp:Transcript_11038/g.32015  ORF Transcript_11038/g.32015 Transcript_11038/m.32015 type:complete len:505 (-) Transcript_11038:1972-3486(-)
MWHRGMRLLCLVLALFQGASCQGPPSDLLIVGTNNDDNLVGSSNDVFVPLGGQDTISTGQEGIGDVDRVAFSGEPFADGDVTPPGRQVVANEDIVTDFDAGTGGDIWFFSGPDFNIEPAVRFCKVQVLVDDSSVPTFRLQDGFTSFQSPGDACDVRANFIVLVGPQGDPLQIPLFNAGAAASVIAANYGSEDDFVPGVFLYTNVNTADEDRATGGLNLNRLVYSSNLADSASDLKILMRDYSTCAEGAAAAIAAGRCDETADNINSAISDADSYVADNFAVGRVRFPANSLVLGSSLSDVLVGTNSGETFIGGGDTDFILTGDGSDRILYSVDDRLDDAQEDSIFDFSFDTDTIVFSPQDFRVFGLNFVSAFLVGADGLGDSPTDINAIPANTNLWVLTNPDNGQPDAFNARAAATQIAGVVNDKGATPGAGFFIYFNEGLQLTRLVWTPKLSNAQANLVVLARFVDSKGIDAVNALNSWSASNFALDSPDGSRVRRRLGGGGR